jgi:zinc protease
MKGPSVLAIFKTALAFSGLSLSLLSHAVLPIEHWKTSQGVRVYFVAAPAIPMLDLQIDFDAGSRFDTRAKAGVASLTNSMLGKGAAGINEAQIAEGFANVGAERGGAAGDDRASLNLRTLTSEPERSAALALFTQLLNNPNFPEAVLKREKERIVQSIRESESKPETIANKTFSRLLYGQHPYGFDADAATVAAISAEDLKQFYQNYYTRDRAVVSMIGAITRAQAEQIAEQLTTQLKPQGAPAATLLPISKPASVDRRIEHPATQSHIFVGTTSIARGNPDYFALLVANYTLGGGGFVSRLYNEVREKRGLAYSVYSYFSLQSQEGPFTIGLQTQREQTETALAVVRETVAKFAASGPTQAEVEAAKNNLIGGFALRIDTNRKILDNVAAVGFYQLPLNYLDTWTDQIKAVTQAQASAVFRKYIDPTALVTVVVGNAKQAP